MIDHKTPLNGLCPTYAEQVLVCTGQDDWLSKVEEEKSGDNLAADLKELLGRGGTFNDVRNLNTYLNHQLNRGLLSGETMYSYS